MSGEDEKRFRVIIADVNPVVAKLPVELPAVVKHLARSEDWVPQHEGLITKEEAETKIRRWGCLGPRINRNSVVLDIEEVLPK